MKLSKQPPTFTHIQKRVVLGLLAMYRQKIQLEAALSDFHIEIGAHYPQYDEIQMILDILRIPYNWTARKHGKPVSYCSDWIVEKIIDHPGTPEQIYNEILAENEVWMPNDISPSDKQISPVGEPRE